MRIVRFISGGQIFFGEQMDARRARLIEGNIFERWARTDHVVEIEKLLAPIIPTDILCIGLNYRQHAVESGFDLPVNPLLFIKAGNTLNHPMDPIPLPRLSSQIDYEAELAVVIGKQAKYVSRRDATKYILGYTIANDVTARDWQREKSLGGGQFARGKSFDGFCPLGPCIVTADEILEPNNLRIKTTLNELVVQDHTTADMIFDIPALIESLSSTMTLRPGAIILTGTPQGVGMGRKPPLYLKDGDRLFIEIEKIGLLENLVATEK
ncbi:MAG: fumarylacetoacetate hydrolase family protein [Tepidisphaeraceae bacterium]